MTETKCGLVAIIGEPNAGKSTLINRLVGGKVSIVTPKSQTTRFNVRGACVAGDTQIVFIDTPGIFAAGKPFDKRMVKSAWGGVKDADAVLLLLDANRGLQPEVVGIIEKLRTAGKPVCLALNKIDRIKKPALLELAKACDAHGVFEQIFMISALKGDGIKDMTTYLAGKMPQGHWLYPADQMSDVSMAQLAAEITREKIFFMLGQELPYAIFVEPEAWEEKNDSVKISQAILVERDGQKKIVLGKGGAKIKEIGMSARQELEKILGKRVHLALFVKVKPDWKNTVIPA